MICPTVRRVTAAAALASALWLAAAPAVAAPRAHRERAVPRASLMGQFLQWLEHVWGFSPPSSAREERPAVGKSVLQPGGNGQTSLLPGKPSSTNSDQGIAIDPNGLD